jgi:DNA (cytosine-5)-methyltransferase 1
MEGFFTVKEAAKDLGFSEVYVRRLIKENRLPADRHGKSWIIPHQSMEDFTVGADLNKRVQDRPASGKRKGKIKALSFFSGALGLDLGLEKAGIDVLLASEIDKACRETISENKPDMALIKDIRDYSAGDIRKQAGLKPKEPIDLVVGGPPCQAFSTAGRRLGFNDDRGNVFLTFIDRIRELKPRFAVIENVRGLLSAPLEHRPHEKRGFGYPPLTPEEEKGGALAHIINMLKKAGYSCSFNLYNSANFGVPQVRERVILICSRQKNKPAYLEPSHSDDPSFGLPRWKTVREALKGLGRKHEHVDFPEKRLVFYRQLKPGQYWKNLPEDLHKKALGNSYYAGGGKTGFLRRVAWDKPSPTLVTHPAMPATDLAHPTKDRPLSVQEYKRIQQFPDDYYLGGSLIDKYRQLGNAVPTGLGEAIGNFIKKTLNKKAIKNPLGFSYSRYAKTDDMTWAVEMEDRRRRANGNGQLTLEI